MNRIAWLILSLFIFAGCQKETVQQQSFPIIQTLPVIDIDPTGATFQGEMLLDGNEPTDSYGFFYRIQNPYITQYQTLELGGPIEKGIFQARLDSALVKGLTYEVKAFVKQGSSTIFGEPQEFISSGTTSSSWSLEAEIQAGFNVYGFSDNQYGYLLASDGTFLRLDLDNYSLSDLPAYPEENPTYFAAVSDPTSFFVANHKGDKLYKYHQDQWEVQSNEIPFFILPDFRDALVYGFSLFDELIFLSTGGTYVYLPDSDTWQTKTPPPFFDDSGEQLYGATHLNGNAYVITSHYALWEYKPQTDTWSKLSSHPAPPNSDFFNRPVVSFTYGDRIFVGPAYGGTGAAHEWLYKEIWAYKPSTNEWERQEPFPIPLTFGSIFRFSAQDHLFLGHLGENDTFRIWKFDPSKG